ncbi:hypothetical protein MT962_000664 [Franconibacter sp. IITDAS19]|uniref:HumD family translesion DNA polymerase n=1 Tax=Franconibacter sp. IITDAS19 TaxID=2930569 RepID=UPI001FF8737C|nr:S24 family peptidase [Franconibacter sp. IITDAS19]MCK1966877.1 hypothetical protein [Franconibacter sp. IITDAS19]
MFASPATDYLEPKISLDALCVRSPASTYFLRSSNSYWNAGILNGALLVVDMSVKPCDGSIVVCAYEGELVLRRLKLISRRCLQNIDHPNFSWPLPVEDDDTRQVYGVVTYVINDARGGEFDDSPVM